MGRKRSSSSSNIRLRNKEWNKSYLRMFGTLVVRATLLVLVAWLVQKARASFMDVDSVLGYPLPEPIASPAEISRHQWRPSAGDSAISTDFMDVQSLFVPAVPFDVLSSALEGTAIAAGELAIDESGTKLLVASASALMAISSDMLRVVWRKPLSDDVLRQCNIFMEKDLVFFPLSLWTFDAMRVNDGVVQWTAALPEDLSSASIFDVTIDRARQCIILITTEGDLFALKAESGIPCAPRRRISCPSSAGTCVLSKKIAQNNQGIFFAARSKGSQQGSSSWIGEDRKSDSVVLYRVSLTQAEADLEEQFMFRVEGSLAISESPYAAENVVALPSGKEIVVALGCSVRVIDAATLNEIWFIKSVCTTTSGRGLKHISSSLEGDAVYVADDNIVFQIAVQRGSIVWKQDFRGMFKNLFEVEEARVLSPLHVTDSGLLLRIGTSRGSLRTVVQAGVILLDRDSGNARYFLGKTMQTLGSLVVDKDGNVFSASEKGQGIEKLGCVNWSRAKQDLLQFLQQRGALAQKTTSGGWFTTSSRDSESNVHLKVSQALAKQLAHAAERDNDSKVAIAARQFVADFHTLEGASLARKIAKSF